MVIGRVVLRVAVALPLLLAACTELTFVDDEVRIRVRNTGSIDLQAVEIGFGAPTQAFGDVGAGSVTTYREFDHAYRYGFVEVVAGGERLVMQPVDFVGETKLPGGAYTFELAVDAATGHLLQSLVRD